MFTKTLRNITYLTPISKPTFWTKLEHNFKILKIEQILNKSQNDLTISVCRKKNCKFTIKDGQLLLLLRESSGKVHRVAELRVGGWSSQQYGTFWPHTQFYRIQLANVELLNVELPYVQLRNVKLLNTESHRTSNYLTSVYYKSYWTSNRRKSN